MRSLDVDDSGTVLMQGAAEVQILGRLNTESKAHIVLDSTVPGLSASQVVFYVAGQDAEDGHRGDREDDHHAGDRGDRRHAGDRGDHGDAHDGVVARIGEQNVVQATIYAQNGAVWLGARTQATGQFIGTQVRVGENVTLTLDGRFQ